MKPAWDVVVVGAGPAGTSAAIVLAERGFRVALVDKARFPRWKPCAEYANPEAMRLLERLGLLEHVREAGAVEFRGMRLVSPSGQRLDLDFTADAGRHALGVSRWVLDALAVERCRALGVEVLEGSPVRRVLVADGAVAGVRVKRRGMELDLLARVVIGADGHHSAIARLLGLERPMRWPRRIGLAAHLEGFPLADEMGEMHVTARGYCGLAPQENGRVNAAMVVDLTTFGARTGSVERYFDAALRAYPGLTERMQTTRRVTTVRGVGPLARRVARVSGAGFVLAGDAAGFFDPVTGEGIYDALRGGVLAAEAIAPALEQGDTSAQALATYDRARREAFAGKRQAAWLVQAFVRSPWLLDYAVTRLGDRPDASATLTGVLGDYRVAGSVLSPRFLWRTLRP
jgi:geranylgeranyl reductase family protein